MGRVLIFVVTVLLVTAAVAFAQQGPRGVDVTGRDYAGLSDGLRLAYAMGVQAGMSAASVSGPKNTAHILTCLSERKVTNNTLRHILDDYIASQPQEADQSMTVIVVLAFFRDCPL